MIGLTLWRSMAISSTCSSGAWRTNPIFPVAAQIQIFHAPLQEISGHSVYDFMISGLPLNNFALSLVGDIFESYERLLKPEGVLSYFEYLCVRTLKMPFVSSSERERLRMLGRFLDARICAARSASKKCCVISPAVARHLRFARSAKGVF